MRRFLAAGVAAALLASGAAAIIPAQARPPTVIDSQGYQARLAESRKAAAAQAQAAQPPTAPRPAATARHKKHPQ